MPHSVMFQAAEMIATIPIRSGSTEDSPICFPLTIMQRAMVLASRRMPGSGVYALQTICTLDHETDTALLHRAWQYVAGRHEILRSTLHIDGGAAPFQAVHRRVDIPWTEHDWRRLTVLEQERQLSVLLDQDRCQGYPLGEILPWRVIVVRTGACASTMIWSAHHALLDGRSQFLVMQELFDVYEALGAGNEPGWEAPVQFREHAEWLLRQDPSRAEHFWHDFVDAAVGEACVVTDRLAQPDDEAGESYIRQYCPFSSELTARVDAFARQHELTLNTILQGAWALLLSRYSGSPNVVFGSTRACRRSSVEGAHRIVGPLINTVPMGVSVPSDMPLLPWLQQLRKRWLDLRPYEHTPLDRIQEWCGASAAKPLFQSLLVYEHQPLHEALQAIGGQWQKRKVSVMQRIDNPITLAAYGMPQLTVELICDRQRFSAPLMERMLEQLHALVEGFVANCATPLAQLPFLSDCEREQILRAWNQTAGEYPRDLCAHEIFEATAAEFPAQTALLDAGQSISYAVLNEKSNQLAHYLRAKGVGPETLVAVSLERSPSIVTAVLAILKAGGAFLPLDPGLPQQRLAHLLDESGAPWVITRTLLAPPFENCAAERLCLETLEAEISRQPKTNLPRQGSCANAAYAIYTSGSTGEPKAVLVEHRSLVNHTLAGRRLYGISTRDRRIQFASIGTDFFVAELFNYISSGATLVFQPAGSLGSILDFLNFLSENLITVTAVPASYWSQWVHALLDDQLPLPQSLRLVIAGMERVDPHLFQAWQKRVGARVQWFNVYGPAETTCTAIAYEAGTSVWEDRTFVPIGRPIANTSIYVLDREQNPVPVGVEGEVYIGGDGVARGYLNRPDLTSERFLPDAFSGAAAARVYRTGDLAFYLPDGNLVFTGRADRQVKIRGFRVELDEVEAALSKHPAVRQCAVTLRKSGNHPFLAAYLTAKDALPVNEELRRHLSGILPDYMIPAVFVRLAAMPLTSSGKIDRKVLPEPPADVGARGSRPPVTAAQKRLSSNWGDVLGLRTIDITDNFFDLGADSLQVVNLLTRVYKEYGRNLTFADLLAAPTIERLAWLLESPGTQRARSCVVALHESDSKPPFFCVHGGDGEVLAFRDLANSMGKDHSFYALQAVGMDGTEAPLQSVEEIAARYIRDLRTMQPNGPYFVGGFCLGAFIALEIAAQLRAENQDVGLVAVINTDAAWRDSQPPFAGLRRHGHRLLQLPRGRKLKYLRVRIGYRWSRIRATLLEACYRMLAAGGSHLPPRLRQFHARETCHRAGQKYKPRLYPGKITCFHGAEEPQLEPGNFWSRVAQEGIDIQLIPGAGLDVLRPPHVGVLGEKLRQSIDSSQFR
jgi:amino acid adenylation domain-containing protein